MENFIFCAVCIKEHRSNIWNSMDGKVKHAKAELKKA